LLCADLFLLMQFLQMFPSQLPREHHPECDEKEASKGNKFRKQQSAHVDSLMQRKDKF
jgi:hypothetical protein